MGYNAPEKTVQIQGESYKGLNIQGKPYAPVNRRIESAHKNGGYTMLRCDWIEIFGIKCCEIVIEIKGQQFFGTSELRTGFSNPISDAQTSALGRALAAAGFDISTAIASAEDMEHVVESNGHTEVVEAEPLALPEPQPPDGLNWQDWSIRLAKSKGIVKQEDYLKRFYEAIGGKKTSYTTSDYRIAVSFFARLPDPVVASEHVDEAASE